MNRYRVRVERTTRYVVEVNAATRREAEKAALGEVIPTDCQTSADANWLAQVGGPWVYGWSGDDLDNSYYGRPDGYMDRTDLLVFQRALGNVFTKADVELLIERVRSSVGPVRTIWNGENRSGLTIQLLTPIEKLSDAQVATLMAPREAG